MTNKFFHHFHQKNVAAEFEKQHGSFYRAPLNRDVSIQFDNIIDTIQGAGKGNISINKAQEVKEILGRAAKFDSANRQNDPKALMAGEAYHIVKKHLDNAIERGESALGQSDLLSELHRARREYGSSKIMEQLLRNREAREQGNKMGTGLTNTIVGAEALNIAAQGKPGLAAGIFGAKQAWEKYGNYTMANSADTIANILQKAPQSLGKYAPILMNASRQGAQSLAVAHYTLSNRDAEYAKLIKNIVEERE